MSDVSLDGLWRKRLNEDPGLSLVDPAHPLELYLGLAETGSPRFVVRSQAKPVAPHLSEVVLVEQFTDKQGRWNLFLTLQDRKYDEVFLRLIDDVYTRTFTSANEGAALAKATVVFEQWRRLLRPRQSGQLTLEKLRGVVGELWLLMRHFAESRPMEEAVEGWLGPLGLPQDFFFEPEGYHEVKAIGPATTSVQIASEKQLDAFPLRLTVITLASASESTPGAVSLKLLADEIRTTLGAAGASSEPLDKRLQELGVDLTDPFYAETWFVVAHLSRFDVGDDFPAIRESDLPAAITHVTYQLELASIADHMSQTQWEG